MPRYGPAVLRMLQKPRGRLGRIWNILTSLTSRLAYWLATSAWAIQIQTLRLFISVGVLKVLLGSVIDTYGTVLASRMAQILKIWILEPADDGVTRELKLRIWWSCFIIDTWASGGSNLSRQVMSHMQKPPVPMDETVFFTMRRGDAVISQQDWRPGLWGYMVNLVEIYAWIQDLHKQLAEAIDWDEQLIQASVADLDAKLASFQQSLPSEMLFSVENLARHARRGLGRTFVAFHLGFHHYSTLLFYLYLDRRRPPTSNGRAYGENCKAHAKAVCDILKASREMEGCEALYSIVGHVTVVSSSVLLHTYLFGEVGDLPDAKDGLESNFESLVLLRGYWSGVELMVCS